MIDYLKWRGDITFRQDPFNLVDNVLLSRLSYIHFEGALKGKMTIQETRDAYKKLHEEEGKAVPEILEEMAESRRFGNARLYNYVSFHNEEHSEQFAALMIDLDDFSTYVAYRGTDGSTIGWKEDFMMLYRVIGAQKEALNYLNTHGRYARKLRVGGHSKGGNLALYASMKADKEVQRKITAVFSNDGPGLGEAVFNKEEFDTIKDRYIQIVPDSDVFGLAFEHDCKRLIVKSSRQILYSHNPDSWQVMRNRFITSDNLKKDSLTMGEAFKQFLEDTTPKQREIFTEELFKALADAKIEHISQIFSLSAFRISPVIKAMKELGEIDPDAKEIASRFLKVFTSVFDSRLNSFLQMVTGGNDDKK